MVALFLFEEDRLVGERVYFDSATILRQLGIAHDPLSCGAGSRRSRNHPLTIGRAVVRSDRAPLELFARRPPGRSYDGSTASPAVDSQLWWNSQSDSPCRRWRHPSSPSC